MERVHFRATADVDLQFIVVLDSDRTTPDIFMVAAGLGSSTVQAGSKDCFWFAAFKVKAGQNVVLYTRAGTPSTETRPDGQVFHFFFRGLAAPKYTMPNRCAVLFEMFSWETSP
jgi:hypothetical protein